MDYQGGNHPQSWANKPDVKDKHWDDYHDPDAASGFFKKFLDVAIPHLAEHFAAYQVRSIQKTSGRTREFGSNPTPISEPP